MKHNTTRTTIILTSAIILTTCLLPEIGFAAESATPFDTALTKLSGWTSGGAGKLITFVSLACAAIFGVLGFPAKHVMSAIGIGLLISSANGIVNMIF